MTQVKICGIKEPYHAEVAAYSGANAIGFVFAESKRKITIDQAKFIADRIPQHIKKVGVFVNASSDELENTYQQIGLDYVQLHGDETPQFSEALSIPYIKALRITSEHDLDRLEEYQNASYFLLDSATGPYQGGNGTSFDWSILKNTSIDRSKLILAGGLNEHNIKGAISQVRPAIVDVSSGVETNNMKDPDKIKQFMQNVKERTICHTHNL